MSKRDVLYIRGNWNAKVGSQEIPGVTGKFSLRIQNEAGERLIEFCQGNNGHRKYSFQKTNKQTNNQELTLHMDITK